MDTQTVMIKLMADIADLQAKMRSAGTLVDNTMGGMGKAAAVAKAALAGIAAGLSVQAIAAYASRLIDAADAMNDMSQRVGIAVKDLAKYELAAAQSGTSMESVAKGIKGLAANMLEHSGALKNAGITATTVDGAIQQLADLFAKMPDGIEKTTLSAKLFGKAGMEWIPMLNLGSKGLAEAADKSAAYAKEMAVAAPLADAFNDNLAHLAMSSKTVGMTLLNEVLPSLTKTADTLATMDTKPAVDAVMAVAGAVAPAAKVAAAYFALFVAAPAVYAMTTAAITPLIHATALHAYNMITGEAATIGLNTSLYGTSVAAQLAAGSLSKMALAGSVLFAAFAGWQFGTYLRDQFVEVRVAGLAFIGAMMSGWEHLTYGAQLAGAALKSLLPGAESFAEAKARLSAQHAANIAVIDQNIVELIQYETSVKSATAAESASADAKSKVSKETKKLLSDLSGTKAAVDEATKGLAKYNDLMDKSAGFDKSWADTARQLRAALDGKKISQEQFNAAILEAYKNQPIMVAAEKARIDAAKENTQAVDDLFDAQEKLRLQNEDQIKTGRTMLEQIEFETRLLSLNTEQRAIATMERELEHQGIIKGTQAYDAYFAKLREASAIKSLAEANKKAAEESGRYWEDALMRAFESGKGFFESLWDTIKNTLKTQILKVLVTGTLTGLGVNTAASAASSTTSGLLTSAIGSSITNSGIASAVTSGVGAFWAGLTASGTTASGAASAGLAYAGAEAAGAGGAFLGGSTVSTGLSAVPVYGWIAAAVLAVLAFAGNKRAPSSGTGEGSATFDALGNITGTDTRYQGAWGMTEQVKATVTSLQGAYALAAQALDITTMATNFAFGGNTGAEGKDPQFALGGGVVGGPTYSSGEIQYTDAAYQLAASRAVFTALQGSSLPKYLAGVFDGMTASAMSIDDINTAIAGATALKGFHDQLQQLPWPGLKDLSYAATMGLVRLAGSLENLQGSLGTFYENFYTDQQKTTDLTRTTSDAFAALGFAMPAINASSRDWYRTLVESVMAQDMSVASNQTLLTNVLSLQGAMNTLAPAFADVEAGIKDLVAGISTRVDSSIFDMQYGMEDNPGKYNMLNVRATRLNDEMQASTDINAIAAMAEDQIALINQAWGLLSDEQQKAKYLEFEDRLEKIDDYVTTRGADAISLQQAADDKTAATIAAAVEAAVEKALASSAAAMQAVADKTEKPIEVTSNVNLTVTAPVGSEVAINA